jgi:cobaltochelatase CobT
MSGSMSGDKFKTAVMAAYALSKTLDKMNIKNELVGFTTRHSLNSADQTRLYESANEFVKSTGRYPSRSEPIYMAIIKDFVERFTQERRFALAQLELNVSKEANADGESLEYANRRLQARPETRKIMIVLSDGMPSAGGDSTLLASHLSLVVKRIMASGTDVFGIGIMDASVRKFYPMCEVLNRIDDLPTTVLKKMEELLFR